MIYTYVKSFMCTRFSDGEGGHIEYLSVEMTMECGSARHDHIKSLAIGGLILGPMLSLGGVWMDLSMLKDKLADRTRTTRNVSPILDW